MDNRGYHVASSSVWYCFGRNLEELLRRLTIERKRWKRGRCSQDVLARIMVTKHGKAAHCRNDCLFLLQSHMIQPLSWCSHCDPNDASDKRAWERCIGLLEQVLNLRVFCISSCHRILFQSCTHDVPDALTLTMTQPFHATRAKVSCEGLRQASALHSSHSLVLLFWSRLRDSGIVWNLRLRQVILALIRIPHVASLCGNCTEGVLTRTRRKTNISYTMGGA